jgi:multidrug efflux pump subunit AcrB
MLMLGAAAIPNMRAQFFPDVISDEMSVSVRWEGAGAEDVDAAIVQVLEPALLAVEGVAASEARSREGSAGIEIEFEPGWDMSRAPTTCRRRWTRSRTCPRMPTTRA